MQEIIKIVYLFLVLRIKQIKGLIVLLKKA